MFKKNATGNNPYTHKTNDYSKVYRSSGLWMFGFRGGWVGQWKSKQFVNPYKILDDPSNTGIYFPGLFSFENIANNFLMNWWHQFWRAISWSVFTLESVACHCIIHVIICNHVTLVWQAHVLQTYLLNGNIESGVQNFLLSLFTPFSTESMHSVRQWDIFREKIKMSCFSAGWKSGQIWIFLQLFSPLYMYTNFEYFLGWILEDIPGQHYTDLLIMPQLYKPRLLMLSHSHQHPMHKW